MDFTINANRMAFINTTGFSAITIGACIAAAGATSTVATVAFAAIALVGAALSTASITAWFENHDGDKDAYLAKFKEHAPVALAGYVKLVAETFVKAIVDAFAQVIFQKINRKFS